ncbi:SH3 domain-containing protein [Leptospira ilyithenensis]|uniref:SH3 domain-containing protein n=1 Tax=Leptospira ilyithenensis TaxID=2484901 RepID=A0A4R9LMP3_9LEPT|nr:SH3 domain-containing protein [Leptospira ilyithenensis]
MKLYLFPDRKSNVLKTIQFGERLFYDNSSLEPNTAEWVPVVTEENLAGFLLRNTLLLVSKNKLLSTVLFEADKLLNLNSTSLEQRMEIADSLFRHASTGEFRGDDFTLIKAKAGFALIKSIDILNEKNIKADSSKELLDFLKRHESKLLFDYSAGKYYVDANYFWKLVENHPNTKHSDYAGYLAAEASPDVDCKGELACELEKLRRSKMKYIYFFPNGNYVSLYSKSVVAKLKEITKDPESIACFQPAPQNIQVEINTMYRYVQDYGLRYRKEILPYIQILQKECLK